MTQNIDKNEWEQRQLSLKKRLQQMGAKAALVSNKMNLYYLLGQIIEGYLLVPAEGETLTFLKRPVSYQGDSVVVFKRPQEMVPHIEAALQGMSGKLLMEAGDLTYNEYKRMAALLPQEEMGDLTPVMREVRSIKTPCEIELLRRSGARQAAVYAKVPSFYREGMSDNDLFIEVEYHIRRAGHLGMMRGFGKSMELFMGSVLAGDNAAAPSPFDFALGGRGMHPSQPGTCNGLILAKGMSVMVDISGNFYGYQCDMSRTYSVGALSQEAYQAHRLCLDIQNAVAQAAKPGVTGEALYKIAIEMAGKSPYGKYFMGDRQKAKFIGHGLGLEINEEPLLAPRASKPLERGMVFALEPKITLPGIGPVGIENTWVVTENGVEKLTLLDEEIQELGKKEE